jgi:hypothetical protein
MLKATAGKILPTTITGSLRGRVGIRKTWGTGRSSTPMVITRFREQYVDAAVGVSAGTGSGGAGHRHDGDCRFNQDIGGQSWTSYPPNHMDGFDTAHPKLAAVGGGGHRVSAGAHPARLPGSAGDAEDRRADRARRAAVCGDVQGGAAADRSRRSSSGR